jgi:hypothetical protein
MYVSSDTGIYRQNGKCLSTTRLAAVSEALDVPKAVGITWVVLIYLQ